MSLKRVINALVGLGLSRLDAEVYVYLAKKGPHKEIDIAQKLRLRNKQLEIILKNLLEKKVIIVTNKYLNEFTAIPFEETLRELIEINKKQTDTLSEIKKELLSSWENTTRKSTKNN